MAIKEQDKVFYEELANGDKVINLPVTRVNNVEGLGRSANTAYVIGEVVYVDNNKKVALKCTQTGTTSNSELNVSTASIGNVITDGTVKWQVCNRTSDVTSVNGKTGDVVVGEITDASIDGKVITLTFADGTTKTLTTQDTVPTAVSLGAATYDYTGRVTQLFNANEGVGTGNITLSQPYTNFDGLMILYGDDMTNAFTYTHYVSTWELQQRKSKGTLAFALIQDYYYWGLDPTSTTTNLICYNNKENCRIYTIWGVK